MYRGFNLKTTIRDKEFYEEGLKQFEKDKIYVRENLSNFINSDNSLDGTAIQENWFPQVKADIFISHSHADKIIAITLAGMLSKIFGLTSFIDSCIWGYSNDLLKIIDKNHCKRTDGYYDYNMRNSSTSHVHMMLSTALTMMIDKTECLFFLNTPSSVKPVDGIIRTESPWIYNEITISQIARKKTPKRLIKEETRYFQKGGPLYLTESLSIRYDMDLGHLAKIDNDTFIKWAEKNHERRLKGTDALDILYTLAPFESDFFYK
jgi:hypothetical protein